MPTIFTKGDIFQTEGLGAFAQGVSAAGVMDAGIAGVFKKKWPRMFAEYVQRCSDGRFHLGDVFMWTEDDATIFNLCIQENWKTKAKVAALVRSLKKMTELAQNAGLERIGIPRIGTGLGGLDWPRVKKVLSEVGAETSVTLVVFEQFVRTKEAEAEDT